MKRRNTCILIGLVISATLAFLKANDRPMLVPAAPWPMEWVQPKGDTVMFYLRGDEHAHFMMTLDGYQVIEQNKTLYYAQKHANGEVKASRKKAHNEETRKKCEKRWLKRHGIQKVQVY